MLSNPKLVQQFQQAQGALSSALSRLMVVVEKYPNLKADKNFLALQSQLEGTENRISVARRDYILSVQKYNMELRTFPGKIIAAILYPEAKVKENFTATPKEQETPKVQF
jgi:LemA protein